MYHAIIVLLLVFCQYILCNDIALISSINVNKNALTITADHAFTKRYLHNNFFVEYEDDIDLEQLDYSIVTIPFILNVIPLVWLSGKTYTIDKMDYSLFYALENIRRVFRIFFPTIKWRGRLIPQELIVNKRQKQNNDVPIGVLFSGGLDALHASLSRYMTPQLLITYWGCDVPLQNRSMWCFVKDKCTDYAEQYGFENSFVRSNFWCFINKNALKKSIAPLAWLHTSWWPLTTQGLGYVGLTAPILYTKGIKKLYIGSSATIDFPYPHGTHPLIDSNISFADITVIHDGADVSRSEKICKIVDVCNTYDLPVPFIRVCWGCDQRGYNCGSCTKCYYTMTQLLIEGLDPREFGFDFDTKDIIGRTKKMLTNRFPKVKKLIWRWQNNKERAQLKLKRNTTFSPDVHDYIVWLAAHNFGPSVKNNVHCQIDSYEALKLLWDLSAK